MLQSLARRALLALFLVPAAASAQDATVPPSPRPSPSAAPDWSDEEGNPAIPDFTNVNLPTTLRLPRHKLAFRITHRFARPLGDGDFVDLVEDLFGFDSGAQVGFDLRFGLFSGTQLGIYRTSDRTIQLYAQQDLLQQDRGRPLSLALYGTFEGLDNLHAERAPGLVLVASRTIGDRFALFVEPGWVGNTNLLDGEGEENNSVILGLGARVRLGDYAIVGEAVPRLGGHSHQDMQYNFAFERRAGGHNFQLDFGNALGSTLAQVARGGGGVHHEHGDHGGEEGTNWYIGFNLTRKFY